MSYSLNALALDGLVASIASMQWLAHHWPVIVTLCVVFLCGLTIGLWLRDARADAAAGSAPAFVDSELMAQLWGNTRPGAGIEPARLAAEPSCEHPRPRVRAGKAALRPSYDSRRHAVPKP